MNYSIVILGVGIENIEFIIIKNQDVNIIVVNIFKIQDFSYKNKSNI